MDVSSLSKLAQDPEIRNVITSVLNQFRGGRQPGAGQQGNGAQPGGATMAGLIDNLRSGGLDDHVRSWVGTGENKPISAAQITQAIGSDKIQRAAQEAGVTPQQAADDLAKVLPHVVDTATPSGQAPSANDFDQLFQRLMGGNAASRK